MTESSMTRVVNAQPGASDAFRHDMWPWLMLAFGAVLRLVVAGVAMQAPQRHLAPDSFGFLALAENLGAGRGFSMATGHPWTPNCFRTPGYPAFITLVAALLPWWPTDVAVIGVQSGLVLVAGAALLRLASRLGLSVPSRLALSVALALDPVAVALSAMVLSETLFGALLAIVLLLWVTALQGCKPLPAFLAGVSIGCLALVRPIAAYFWVAPVLTLVLAPGRRPRRWLQVGLVIAGTSCVTLPWSLRNHWLGSGFSVSSMSRSQMIEWQAAIIESRARGLSRSAVVLEYEPRYGNGTSGPKVLLDVVSRYPHVFVSSSLASLALFFVDPGHHVLLRPLGIAPTGLLAETTESGKSALARIRDHLGGTLVLAACTAWLVLSLSLAALGARRSGRDPERRMLVRLPALLTITYFACLSLYVVLAEGARLRAPILPALALLGAVAIGGRTGPEGAHPRG